MRSGEIVTVLPYGLGGRSSVVQRLTSSLRLSRRPLLRQSNRSKPVPTTARTVSITDATPEVTIYYTVDGTTPTTSSLQYIGGAITISSTETLKADGFAPGYARSAVRTAIFTIQ
jgi:hypothetical protein